jgi:hypothetical protein
MSEGLTIKPFDHATVIKGIEKLKRGLVWCTVCGRCQKVDSVECFRRGWPECCGFTMTIDSPEERAAINSKALDQASNSTEQGK